MRNRSTQYVLFTHTVKVKSNIALGYMWHQDDSSVHIIVCPIVLPVSFEPPESFYYSLPLSAVIFSVLYLVPPGGEDRWIDKYM